MLSVTPPNKIRPRFIPLEGSPCSWYNSKTDSYIDVKVKRIQKRLKQAIIEMPSGNERTVSLKELEAPLNPDINTRFHYFEKMVKLALNRRIPSLIVAGKGGIGKSFTLSNMIKSEELEEADYMVIKGYSTALALYETLYNYSNKIVVFDDCDSILKDSNALNILKSVLDSYSERKVSWLTSGSRRVSSAPPYYIFSGTVIFLSNWDKEDFDQTILSRSVMIDLHMTEDELIDRMKKIIDFLDVGKDLSRREKLKVISIISKYKKTVSDLNLRTLRKALSIYEESKDMELVRYQILNG